MTTLPLIQDCVLIAVGTIGFNITGEVVLAGNLTDAATAINVNADSIAYVLGDEGLTYSGSGAVEPLASDRSAWNTGSYANRHASDISDSTYTYHNDPNNPALSPALTDGHIFVGDTNDLAADVAMSGDATIINTGALTLKNTGPGATGPLGGATVAPIITIDAQGRVTALSSATITGVTPAAHQLTGALHTESGLTAGDVLTALTSTTFGFATPASSGAVNVYNETITADGISTIYYLLNIAAPSTIRVYIDGIRQPATDDAAPTDIVTFDVAPDLGAVLLFDYEMDIT